MRVAYDLFDFDNNGKVCEADVFLFLKSMGNEFFLQMIPDLMKISEAIEEKRKSKGSSDQSKMDLQNVFDRIS